MFHPAVLGEAKADGGVNAVMLDLLLVARPLSASQSVFSALCRLLQGGRQGRCWPRKKDVALVGDSPALGGLENHRKERGGMG